MENKMRTILKNFDEADKVFQIIFADEYECTLEGGWCYIKTNDSKKKEEQRSFLDMNYNEKKLYSIEHANRYVEYCKEMSWEEFEKEWNWCDKFGEEIATGIGCCVAKFLTDHLYNPRYWEWDTSKEPEIYNLDAECQWIIERAIQFGIKLNEKKLLPDDDIEDLAKDFKNMLNEFIYRDTTYNYFSEFLEDNLTERTVKELRRSSKRKM